MRAEEAKRIAANNNREKITHQYSELLATIQRKAADGHMQFIFHGYMYPENKEALLLLGYKLNNDRGTDSLIVSWREATTVEGDSSIIIPAT